MKHLPALLIASISLVISLSISEIVLRYKIPLQTGTSYYYRVPDQKLGWRLKKNTRYLNKLKEETTIVSYNSRGWRDREHAITKPIGVKRVLLLGDSFLEAYSVNFEDSFTYLLEEKLNRTAASKIESINLGVGGYGTLQAQLAYHYEGAQYSPDIVLLGF